jgi:hypothetical protein
MYGWGGFFCIIYFFALFFCQNTCIPPTRSNCMSQGHQPPRNMVFFLPQGVASQRSREIVCTYLQERSLWINGHFWSTTVEYTGVKGWDPSFTHFSPWFRKEGWTLYLYIYTSSLGERYREFQRSIMWIFFEYLYW